MLRKKLSMAALVLAGLSADLHAQTPTAPAPKPNPTVAADKAQLQADRQEAKAARKAARKTAKAAP